MGKRFISAAEEALMRRLICLLVACAAVVGLGGCFNYDPEHNARIWSYIRKDLRIIRQDLDLYLGMDGPSHLDRTEY